MEGWGIRAQKEKSQGGHRRSEGHKATRGVQVSVRFSGGTSPPQVISVLETLIEIKGQRSRLLALRLWGPMGPIMSRAQSVIYTRFSILMSVSGPKEGRVRFLQADLPEWDMAR